MVIDNKEYKIFEKFNIKIIIKIKLLSNLKKLIILLIWVICLVLVNH